MPESQGHSGLEVTDPAAYITRIMDSLGDRDPIEVFAETPGELKQRVEFHPAEVLQRRPYPDRWTWTPLEVIGHLLDVEWALGCRTRAVFSEESPTVIGFDQDDWVKLLKHNERDPAELVEEFSVMRSMNLRFWRSVPEQAMGRAGVHNERGKETLGEMLRLYAGHDRYHLNQFDRYLEVLLN